MITQSNARHGMTTRGYVSLMTTTQKVASNNSLLRQTAALAKTLMVRKAGWHRKRIPSAARMLIMAVTELRVAFSTGITRWYLTRSRTISTMVHSSQKLALHHTRSNWWKNCLKRKAAELRMFFRKAISGSRPSINYCWKLCLYRFQLLSFSLGSGFF